MVGIIRGSGAKTRYLIDYKEVTKEIFDAAFPDKPITEGSDLLVSADWKKPVKSDALAVHPKQVKEAREDAAKKGVPVEFLPDGRPVFRNRQERKQYMNAYGFFDKDAGYSDRADGSAKREVDPRDY